MTQSKNALDQPAPVKQPFEFRKLPEKIALFILDLAFPTLVAAVVIYYLSGAIKIPYAYQGMILWMYGAALILISLVVALAGNEIPRIIRKKKPASNRWIKTGFSGLGVPLFVLFLANFSNMPNGQSYLAYYLPSSLVQGVTVTVPTISSAILQNSDVQTKVAGIHALGAIRDTNNLKQLVQLLGQPGSDFNNAVYYQALSNAFAAYGVQAKPALISQFYQWSQAITASSTASSATLYDQYFAGSLQALRSSITNADLDSAEKSAQLQQLDGIEKNLQSDLGRLQVGATNDTASDIRLDLILDTFFRMTIQQDAEILNLAKGVAANPVYPAVDRKKAILLIGKLGTKDDLGLISTYLQDSSETIKAGALEAMILLEDKSTILPQSPTPVPGE